MQSNRGRDTGPELALRRALWREGIRYRLRYPLPGRPDLVFPRKRLVVFVDGCFWHCCPEHGAKPKTNAEFWNKKLARNVARDREVTGILREEGWTVLRVWEHEVKQQVDHLVQRIARLIAN